MTLLQEMRGSFARNKTDIVVNNGQATDVAFNRSFTLQHLIK